MVDEVCDGQGPIEYCSVCNKDGRYTPGNDGREVCAVYPPADSIAHSNGFRIGLLEKRLAILEQREKEKSDEVG